MADRFYCPEPLNAGRLHLQGDEARHLARVRRLGPGDVVEVFDGRSVFAHRAEVRGISGDRVELAIQGDPVPGREPPLPLTLAAAVPKGERFDWLVEKAVEVGVGRLVPLIAARSVVEPRPGKLEKQRRAVIEASKQCGRNRLMEVASPSPLGLILREEAASVRLLAHPDGLPISEWPRPALGQGVTLAVGPEGGFTTEEVEAARSAGWQVVALGPTILRVETAALVGSALVLAMAVPEAFPPDDGSAQVH